MVTINNKLFAEMAEAINKLEAVQAWATARRNYLDNNGPCLITRGGVYLDVGFFEGLEEILGPDQTEE